MSACLSQSILEYGLLGLSSLHTMEPHRWQCGMEGE